MSYISKKKRSKNFVVPSVMLVAGTTAALASLTTRVSADTVEKGSVASSGNTITGWDTEGKETATPSDATTTLSSATSDMSDAADSRASSVTSQAPKTTSSVATGWVDVYVNHDAVNDAIENATAQGVRIQHDPTIIQMGDASATAKNTSAAVKYYSDKAVEITSVATKYTNDMANYRAEVAKNKSDADNANAEMDALRTNLAAQGQTTKLVSKQYSADGVAADTKAIQSSIADGRAYLDALNAIQNAQTEQDSMVLFTTGAAQGHIKLTRQNVTIATPADAQKYLKTLEDSYTQLQSYLDGLSDQTGSIPDSSKPTYTLYNFTIDATVQAKGVAPVNSFHYLPIPVTKPTVPTVKYNIYDIRSQPTSKSSYDNKDGEVIILGQNGNAQGQVVAQAMVNQTVGIDTDRQPLPSERFDKIEDLTVVTQLPDDTIFDEKMSNTDPANWTLLYDKTSNTVRQTATPEYLVQLNLKQNINGSGTVGGTTNGEWDYHTPQIFFKLTKDNHTYQAFSTTIVNKEYMYVGEGVQIRTDQADPSKVNTNSLYQNIDGKAVLPGSINNYVLGWDFNQYKNVNIDSEMQEKGLRLVDDYPEGAVSLTGPISVVDPADGKVIFSSDIPEGIAAGATGTFQGTDGKDVDGLTWIVIDNDSAPDDLKSKLNGLALELVYTGKDNAFYKTYVEGGKNVNVIMPMTTLKINNSPKLQGGTYNGNIYKNYSWQSDFGNPYRSNHVFNMAPLLDPKKDAVLAFGDLTSLDINNNELAEIENGSYFQYRLTGSTLPTNLSEDPTSYSITDAMDTASDRYDGEYIVQAGSKITFKEGSTLAKRYPNGIAIGGDVSKYFTQTIKRNVSAGEKNTLSGATDDADKKVTLISLDADKDFVEQIDYTKTNLHFDAFLTTKRIADNDEVKNVFNELINDIDYGSNEVVTNTARNALDKLADQLSSLQDSTASGITSNASGVAQNSDAITSMTGALSVIVKNVTEFKAQTSSAVDSLTAANSTASSAANSTATSYFDYTSEQISLVASHADSATSSVATSASSAIAENSSAISSVASDVNDTITGLASATSKAVGSLADILAAKTEQAVSTLTIYDNTVVTDADALEYATNHGIAAGSIKSITLDKNNKFVVSYNTSKTGINNSTSATSTPVNADKVAKQMRKIDFYTLKDSTEVYAQLLKLGYAKDNVVSVTQGSNGVFTAIINVPASTKTTTVKA